MAVKENIKAAYKALVNAEKDFERTFQSNAKLCKFRNRICYRQDMKRKKYYYWGCMLKNESFVAGCTSNTCPYIVKGLRLKPGGMS